MTTLAKAGIPITIPGSWVPVVIVLGLICLVITVVMKIASVSSNMRKAPPTRRSGSYTIDPDDEARR